MHHFIRDHGMHLEQNMTKYLAPMAGTESRCASRMNPSVLFRVLLCEQCKPLIAR